MNTRSFGRTGLEVSEIAFGGGYVGGILIHADDDTKRAALRLALDRGINWIDTAPAYGAGKSEEALGWLLREVDESPYLSTKVTIAADHLDDIPGQIEASLSASLTRLGRESVTLLQLHNPIRVRAGTGALGLDNVLGQNGVADGLDRMRRQGLTEFIGFTALGDAAACRETVASGRFDSAQVYYNLLNPSAGRLMPQRWSGHDFGGVIDACRDHGVAVMNIRALAAGVLATDHRTGREMPVTTQTGIAAEERRTKAVFEALGTDHGSRAQTAIRFSLANDAIACVIVGLAELSHLEEALEAAARGPLPAEALGRLDPVYASGFGRS
ncbi:MAG: aldo/keto reductase [Alphaproteobacteria bacterium]|jgi:aryl-alcohol dehydrogenase-like predicted oxidoreductase|nr:aldo/keto reductase [Alphaproteobacteria bacterium]MDP6515638.1 aldo/keto reductase [Alphaproteobacteria bacterium]